MTFPTFWVHYYTILVDELLHKLCNFLSVMGGFNVLDGRGEDIGYGWEADNRNTFSNLSFICSDSVNDYKLE